MIHFSYYAVFIIVFYSFISLFQFLSFSLQDAFNPKSLWKTQQSATFVIQSFFCFFYFFFWFLRIIFLQILLFFNKTAINMVSIWSFIEKNIYHFHKENQTCRRAEMLVWLLDLRAITFSINLETSSRRTLNYNSFQFCGLGDPSPQQHQ